jgi:uncharacterized phage infection (PIP) family protein YhgE
MEIFKKLIKSRLFLIGLLVPLIFQIVYLCIAIPAIKDGNNRIIDLKIAIVNEDQLLGKDVAANLVKVLPFKTSESSDLTGALDSMNNGDVNMVIYIAPDFTAKIQQNGAQVSYYINQSAPAMTKQAMEKVALSLNQTLNENSFNNIKDILKQNVSKGLSQSGLSAVALTQIGNNLDKAFDSLKYTTITADIKKVNNAEGFAQSVLPFFIFLIYFVGCIILTILHYLAYKSIKKEFSQSKILVSQFITNVVISLIIPVVVIGIVSCFALPLSLSVGTAWLLLSAGFFTLLYTVQMFANWFGIPGMGIAALLLFPLQLVSSGLIYSKEILPSFYSGISSVLPANYFGDGILKLFYGELSIARDILILLLMSAIFIMVSALTVFRKQKA